MTWSKRRKILYASIVLLLLVGAVGVPLFLKLYKPATCFDGVRNGKEIGVDCDGACEKLCPSSFMPASVSWTRFEQVAPGLYNVAAYIVNPNTNAEADDVPYRIILYDRSGVPIAEVSGKLTLPPHRNTLAFVGALSVNKSVPVKASFEFLAEPQWYKKADTLKSLIVVDKQYEENRIGSSLRVQLANSGVTALGPLSVYAILYDKDKNALGFSKTIVDEIPAQGSNMAPFTWPINHQGKVISQEVLPVAQ